MTVEQLHARLTEWIARGQAGRTIDVIVSPTHGRSCALDDRHFSIDDAMLIGDTPMLTCFDSEWTPDSQQRK